MDMKKLRRIPLLSNVDIGLLDRCISRKQIFAKKYAKGSTVHHQHDRCALLDLVLSGNLVAYSLADNGSSVMMFEFRENSIIGANLLFGDSGTYPLNVYAVAPCELLHVTKRAVTELLRDYNFVMSYIQSLSLNAQGMNAKIAMLAQKTLRENLLDYLRHQTILQGSSDINLPLSKKQLADYLGVQRPSLFRELKKMKDEGLIEVSNRAIRILKHADCEKTEA